MTSQKIHVFVENYIQMGCEHVMKKISKSTIFPLTTGVVDTGSAPFEANIFWGRWFVQKTKVKNLLALFLLVYSHILFVCFSTLIGPPLSDGLDLRPDPH